MRRFQSSQKQPLIRQKRKKYRRRSRSYGNPRTKFHHQCLCRRRFDYRSGLLRTWRGPENPERCRGWIEKGISGCRQAQNLQYRETFTSYGCLPTARPGTKRATVASTLDYLRKVADRKGISFYTHTIFVLSTN